MKRCPNCAEVKSLSEFSIRKSGERSGQPISCCKACNSKRAAEQRKRRSPDHYRRIEWPSKIRRTYGLEVADYERILVNQGGGCGICGSKTSRGRTEMLPVDHDHETGKVRGILCTPCNRALGLFNDDTDRLLAAVRYLKG